MSLTVACLWVDGHVGYSAEYVFKLRSMAARALPAHSFVCLTDRPAELPGIDTIRVGMLPGFAWWTKVELFNRNHAPLQSGRILYLDLDVLLIGRLDSIVSFEADFAIVPHAGNFNGKGARKVCKRYNSSVMSWNGGEFNWLRDDWTPPVTERLWGDQDWLGEQLEARTMPLEWFPRLSEITEENFGARMAEARVVLCKKPKNTEAAARWPWVNEAWR